MPEDEIKRIIGEADLNDKYRMLIEKEPDTEKQLRKIIDNYYKIKACYSKKCEGTAQQLLMLILSDKDLSNIHSARYRIKSVDSLVGKYIKKKAFLSETPGKDYDIEKYRPMDGSNYNKLITDLIGIRILIRYPQQWEEVHDWIWDTFHKEDKAYIKNWLEEYPANDTEDFLVEKPKVYLRDEKERPIYQVKGKDIFDINVSKEGYSSLHYLLWYDGKYVEIQVRTIYDEAWGECTHDLVYKCKDKSKRREMEQLSVCLATQTRAAGMIASIMFEKTSKSKQNKQEEQECKPVSAKQETQGYKKLQNHIAKMKLLDDGSFNGSIDGLIE